MDPLPSVEEDYFPEETMTFAVFRILFLSL